MRVVLDRDDSGLGAVKLSRDERAFFKAGVARLTAQASLMSDIKIKTWTVTSFEVERGFLLGSDTTSRVRVGRWLGKLVGILEMKDGETWKTLRSPLIQTFLGASTVDEPPFLLLPHSTGNIMEYISRQTETPNYGRLAHDIIRGLEYLHTRQPPIVHGNLRPTVVQVDAQGNAVLSSVGLKTSDLSMSAEEATRFEHDLNIWRAPEVVAGESCTEASDVFAWGRIVRAMIEHLEEFHQFSPPLDGKELLQRLCDSATHADPSSRPTASKIVEQILGLSDVAPTSEYSLLLTHSLMDEGGMADPAMDRWRFVPCSRHQYGEITSEYDVLYLKTRPISGLGDHPLRQLSFEIRCHDQGKEATSADPRDGTWAWVEIAILRSNDSGDTYEVNLEEDLPNGHYRGHMVANTRHEIMRLPFADNTPRIHHIVLNQTHPFVRAVRKGDCVALYPKAM
ncbi:kinase-like domain-containing protein [Pterulicium gracile]|uniref:Kinase-like domain-containing protein n=1 Tax=Pterulicium gracile TaxID=1884261 RepID=A0A5C3QVV9_9AGAR|nr:kinase-like domain-containing protein [Pterula gracilis]